MKQWSSYHPCQGIKEVELEVMEIEYKHKDATILNFNYEGKDNYIQNKHDNEKKAPIGMMDMDMVIFA